ncbi:MAG: hypothetical protein DRP97_00510 [Candidatus Latescibacterota bacterium]|nr:MAG: hypothetical protein DRP97_00510 [Candidatus Latescibacterota bacterium]
MVKSSFRGNTNFFPEQILTKNEQEVFNECIRKLYHAVNTHNIDIVLMNGGEIRFNGDRGITMDWWAGKPLKPGRHTKAYYSITLNDKPKVLKEKKLDK